MKGDRCKELAGRAEEVAALENAGALDPSYASKRLDIIVAAMQSELAALERELLEKIRDRWA